MVGNSAGGASLTSVNNTFFGNSAGSNSTGSYNIAIGSGTTVPTAGGDGQIVIGTNTQNIYIQGGLGYNVLNITATGNLTFPFPQFIILTVTATITLTFPTVSIAHRGAVIKLKRNTGAFNVTFQSTASALIFKAANSVGAATANIVWPSTTFQTEFICDGSIWHQITQT